MKILFLDCDGTIRTPLSGETFPQHPRDFQIMTGADRAITYYHYEGWICYGLSNQGGVPQYKSLAAAIAESRYTLELFPELQAILIAPADGSDCWKTERDGKTRKISGKYAAIANYRKPAPGMIEYLLMLHEADPADCWMVGDRAEDEEAAGNAGINFMNADIWRQRFTPGIKKIEIDSIAQLEFLEPKARGLYQ
ncbi:MAG: HAD-IIIA family hydrolase [Limnospira sp.]